LFSPKYIIEIIIFIVVIYLASAFFAWSINPATWCSYVRGIDAVLIVALFVMASMAKGGE